MKLKWIVKVHSDVLHDPFYKKQMLQLLAYQN